MNNDEVYNRFYTYSGLDPNDTTFLVYCDDARDKILAKLKKNIKIEEVEYRLYYVIALSAFYNYLCVNGCGIMGEAFSAGDIKLSPVSKDNINMIKGQLDLAMQNIKDLFDDTNFFFSQI